MESYTVVSSSANQRYKDLLKIKAGGRSFGMILVEGEDLVDLARDFKALKQVITLDYDYKYADYDQLVLTKGLYRGLSSYQSLPKCIGVASFSLGTSPKGNAVYLDGIQDPGNLGTIERTAMAFGFQTVAVSPDSVSPFNFKAVQASKGAVFALNIISAELKELKEAGYGLYMADMGGKDLRGLSKPASPFAIVIGNEGRGLRKASLDLATAQVRIPIDSRIDSLNAAIAAGIMMFAFGDGR